MYKDIQPRLLRMRYLIDYTGLSRAYIYQKINEGSFPTGTLISAGIRVWEKSEIDAYLDEQLRRGSK